MSVEVILKNLQSAVAALDELDRKAVGDDDRLVFIADQLRAHADRIAPWRKCYPLIPLYVGTLTEEVLRRWKWPAEMQGSGKIMAIVQRACAHVVARDRGYTSYDDAVGQVCGFVEIYAMGAGIAFVPKEPTN
jgi:hypothetical protein